jgi:hypothetical protein
VFGFIVAFAGLKDRTVLAQAGTQGQWRTVTNQLTINPVHVALMNTGKVLIVSGSGNVATETNFQAAVWDPLSQTFQTQPTPWDMFCNGMVVLHDGRVFINGGNLQYDPFFGEPRNAVYTPATGLFTAVLSVRMCLRLVGADASSARRCGCAFGSSVRFAFGLSVRMGLRLVGAPSRLLERREKLARARGSGELEPDRTSIRLDGDVESKEPAAMPLGLDDTGDHRQDVVRRRESQPIAVVKDVVLVGAPNNISQQSLPSRLKRRGAKGANYGKVRHTHPC